MPKLHALHFRKPEIFSDSRNWKTLEPTKSMPIALKKKLNNNIRRTTRFFKVPNLSEVSTFENRINQQILLFSDALKRLALIVTAQIHLNP